MGMISDNVKSLLQSDKISILSTSDKDGKNNVAMFGSLMANADTLQMMLGDNRTFANLGENPNAALLVILPGKRGMQTEGCRLYLKVKTVENGGALFEKMKAGIRARVGGAAEALKHLVTFEVIDERPIVDMGQGI
jgi:flavin-binding protein dodecin